MYIYAVYTLEYMLYYIHYIIYVYAVYNYIYTGNTGALLALARLYTHVDDNDKVQTTCRKVSSS